MDLPPPPELGCFKNDPTYKRIDEILQDLHFDINLLFEEDLLFYFGLSPMETEFDLPLSIQLKLDFLCDD